MDRQKKILVADDDRVTREMLDRILTKAGYEVVFAEDGLDAVEKASSERPDLVLMDGLMPKMHGFLACKTIKQLETPPKVILLTGIYTKPTYKWEVKGEYQGDALLCKPFDRITLLDSIEELLHGVAEDDPVSSPRETVEAAAETAFPVESVSMDLETGFAITQAHPEEASTRR